MSWTITNEKLKEKIEDISTLAMVEPDFEEAQKLYGDIYKLLNGATGKKMTPYLEIKTWRGLGKKMLAYMKMVDKFSHQTMKEQQRLKTMKSDRANKRWTPEEDELLIELLCNEEYTLLDVSKTIGRSITAINTRVSTLVGIKRTNQEIRGLFTGKLNGMIVDGTIDGLLTKET